MKSKAIGWEGNAFTILNLINQIQYMINMVRIHYIGWPKAYDRKHKPIWLWTLAVQGLLVWLVKGSSDVISFHPPIAWFWIGCKITWMSIACFPNWCLIFWSSIDPSKSLLCVLRNSIAGAKHLANQDLHRRIPGFGLLERVLKPPLDTIRNHIGQRSPVLLLLLHVLVLIRLGDYSNGTGNRSFGRRSSDPRLLGLWLGVFGGEDELSKLLKASWRWKRFCHQTTKSCFGENWNSQFRLCEIADLCFLFDFS